MKKLVSQKAFSYQKTAVVITAVLAREFGSAYFVGGTVRDLLLGRPSSDIDIATSATATQVKKTLKKMCLPAIALGEKFGTILTIVDDHKIEITTYRKESGYTDSRHPDRVAFVSSPAEDSKRRDFTVNALYLDPQGGEVLDFHHGLKDLQAKKLRFIGDAQKRITEDPLRMLRAVRFATTAGFTVEAVSRKAIIKKAKLITNVSGERIRDELDKIMADKNYHAGIAMLDKLGLLGLLLPEVERLKTVGQSRNYHAEGNVFIHTMKVFAHAADRWNKPQDAIVADEDEVAFRYAVLFHDLGKFGTAQQTHRDGRKHVSFPQHGPVGSEIFLSVAARLKFSGKRTKRIASVISHHMDLRHIHDIGTKTMIAWMQRPQVLDLIRLRYADDGGAVRTNASGKVIPTDFSGLVRFEKAFLPMHARFSKEFVSGEDVMRTLGVKTGKEVGEILNAIRVRQATGEITSRAKALKVLTEIKNSKNS